MIKKFWNWGWGVYHKNEELWNYLIVGGLTTFISIIIKWGLLFTILDSDNAFQLQIAVIISWIVAFLFAYICNRIFVFKSKNKKLKEFIKFFISRITTLLMEMFLMWFFITLLKLNSNVWVIIWTLVVQVLVIVFNYIFSKIFVFKEK
jgi:putative flippase GtrA